MGPTASMGSIGSIGRSRSCRPSLAERLAAELPETLALTAIPNRRLAAEAAPRSCSWPGLGRGRRDGGGAAAADRGTRGAAVRLDRPRGSVAARRAARLFSRPDLGPRGSPPLCRSAAPARRRTECQTGAVPAGGERGACRCRPTPTIRCATKLRGAWCRSCAAFLQGELPEYMVPSAFVLLDSLPLTAQRQGGPRRAPRAGSAARRDGGDHVAPRTPVEEVLAGIWGELLGSSGSGRTTTSSTWAATRCWPPR